MDKYENSSQMAQSASLLLKTTAAADEINRLLLAEKQWKEEKNEWQRKTSVLEQRMLQQSSRIKVLEENHTAQTSSWRKERDELVQEVESLLSLNIELKKVLEAKSQAEVMPAQTPPLQSFPPQPVPFAQARFALERKGWAERVQHVEQIAAAASQEAKSAADDIARLQVLYTLFGIVSFWREMCPYRHTQYSHHGHIE